MVAPILVVLAVLQNLLNNGQFDSVAVELESDDFLIITHRAVGFTHSRGISLDALPSFLPDKESELMAWVMEMNMYAEASLIQQAMPEGTTIH